MYNRTNTEDGNRSYPKWPHARDQVTHRQGDRLWVEISDDDEPLCSIPAVFHGSNKQQAQVTPPLDLSVMDKGVATKPGRQAESPLDLSVKTRKRYADTTNMDEHQLRQAYGQNSGPFPASASDLIPNKRMRMTPEIMAYSQESLGRMAQSQFVYEQNKPFSQDSVIRKKIVPNQISPVPKTAQGKKYPASSPVQKQHNISHPHQSDPQHPTLSQQYSTIQRQHQLSRAGRSSGIPQNQFEPRSQPQGTSYESIQPPRSRSSTTSETVALQGFFEPTHKVTVNTSSHVPVSGYQHNMLQGMMMQQPEQNQLPLPSQPLPNQHTPYSVARQMPMISSADDISSQVPYLQSNPHYQVANIRTKVDANPPKAQEYELMQQKKIQQQRQLQQFQRANREQLMENMRYHGQQQQINSSKMMNTSDQQRTMLGMYKHKHIEQSAATPKRQYPSSQGLPSSHFPAGFPAAAIQSQASPHSDQVFSGTRFIKAGQPEPLSDISQHSRTIEKAERIQTNPNPMSQTQRHSMSGRHLYQNDAKKHGMVLESERLPTHPDAIERTLTSLSSHSVSREQMYQLKEQQSVRAALADREQEQREQVACLAASMGFVPHAGVIQRPKGFIPPRVVSGSGRPSVAPSATTSRPPAERIPQTVSQENAAVEKQRGIQNDISYQQDIAFKRQPEGMNRILHAAPNFIDDTSLRAKQMSNNVNKLTDDVRHQTKGEFKRESSHNAHQQRLAREKFKTESLRKPQPIQAKTLTSQSFSRPGAIGVQSSNTISANIPPSSTINSFYNQSPSISKETRVNQVPDPAVSNCANRSLAISRSITKGTSGVQEPSKRKTEDDGVLSFSQLVMRELKKTDDDITVNPFANRSLLQEYDRSANSSPVRLHDGHSHSTDKTKHETGGGIHTSLKETRDSQKRTSENSYTLPLQIAIPGHKQAITTTSSASVETTDSKRSTVTVTTASVTTSSRNPRMMSRKHMILSAYKNEEDLKNTVNIDKDEKIPIESSKFAQKRHEKDAQSFPPSPKMPILSPQEKNRVTPIVSAAGGGEPPVLEGPSASNVGNGNSSSKPNKEINLLEEHLHRLISDAVKGSFNKDKESVYETVCRELTTQQPQGHKLFRQVSQTRNIPVANVAPIVHGKNLIQTETSNEKDTFDQKVETDLDDEEKKMAELVTNSLFGRDHSSDNKRAIDSDNTKKEETVEIVKDSEGECSSSSFPGLPHENIFDENSNSKRMSPGIKKLMLFRQRDMRDGSQTSSETISNDKSKHEPSVSASGSPKTSRSPRDVDKTRNVFGAFNEILAQKCGGSPGVEEDTCWPGTLEGGEEHIIQLQPNTDYEGDNEEEKAQQKTRRNPQSSSVKRQASRLIRKARHRRKTGGSYQARIGLTGNRRVRHRRFVDFKPLVLPRRTRQKKPDKSPQRRKTRKKKSQHNDDTKTQLSDTVAVKSHQKSTRRRRASSVDRETATRPSKMKGKQAYFSDNEVDHADFGGIASDSEQATQCGVWQNEDESTDEEYFRNYADDLKSLGTRSATQSPTPKKTTTVKKKKGFHFQQKYIFQRKRKSKGRAKPFEVREQPLDKLDAIYNFHEDGPESFPLPCGPSDHVTPGNIPIPVEVKRVAVNKDTGETLLHRAAKIGYEEVALYCLATGSVDVNARDNAGYTALHECAVRGGVSIARHLLKYGADVNCCSVDGIRPIHDAVENDQLEMVRLLLSFGSDPTLSTYAGRTLMKIARTERMRNYLQAYTSDLNGYAPECPGKPWSFRTSSTSLDLDTTKGCCIFEDVPSDPEDETEDMFLSCNKPLYNTCNLAIDLGKRKEDYILLTDVLGSYNVSEDDLDSLSLPSHLVKHVPAHVLKDHLSDSVFCESFSNSTESVPAVRKVDLSQVISRLDRHTMGSHSRRSKS